MVELVNVLWMMGGIATGVVGTFGWLAALAARLQERRLRDEEVTQDER